MICTDGVRQRRGVPVAGVEAEVDAIAVDEDSGVTRCIEVMDSESGTIDELIAQNV